MEMLVYILYTALVSDEGTMKVFFSDFDIRIPITKIQWNF